MQDHIHGIVLGMIAAAVGAPLLVKLWQSVAPSRQAVSEQLGSKAAKRLYQRVLYEAYGVTLLVGAVVVFTLGPGSPLDLLGLLMMMTGILGVPIVYVTVRSLGGGREALDAFVYQFEMHHKTSFRSWLIVGAPSFLFFVGSFVFMSLRT
jgi:hypothetical protein